MRATVAASEDVGVLELRRYEEGDAASVWRLHDDGPRQMGVHAGDGPWDDDPRSVAATYSCVKPRMLRFVGRKADGWVPSLGPLSPEELRAGNERIDAAAEAAGRDPRQIRRVLNLQGVIGQSRTPPGGRLPVGYMAGEPRAGPPEWWAETLIGFARDGFDTLVFWPVDASPRQVELFSGEVVPLLCDSTPDRGQPPDD